MLNTIKTSGQASRTEVARLTGLSPATITGITADLIAGDLVFEKASGDSRGGRRPILFAVNPRGRYVIGLKLTETQVIGALTDLEATVIAKRADSIAGHSLEQVLDTLSAAASGCC